MQHYRRTAGLPLGSSLPISSGKALVQTETRPVSNTGKDQVVVVVVVGSTQVKSKVQVSAQSMCRIERKDAREAGDVKVEEKRKRKWCFVAHEVV